MIRSVAIAALCAIAAPAYADDRKPDPKPDPSAIEAGEANLDSSAPRKNVTLTIALGGALTLGLGIEDAVGRGGAGSVRLGKVATGKSLITLELTTSALFHRVGMDSKQNNVTSLMIGAQYFARPRLWIRAATGYSVYKGDDVLIGDGTAARHDITLRGVGGTFGVGLDFAKVKRFSVGIEGFSTAVATLDGVLSSSAFLLNASFD